MSYVKIIDKKAENTFIIFSSINTLEGKFRFEHQISKLKVNAILLNTINNDWYLKGVPGVSENKIDFQKWLINTINNNFNPDNIYALGSSMGAAGMIHLLSGMDIKNSYAFCPEIFLFEKDTFSLKNSKYPHPKKDLTSDLLNYSKLTCFYGENSFNDLGQYIRIAKQKNINFKSIAEEAHGVIEAIYFTEGLEKVFNNLISDKEIFFNKIKYGDAFKFPGVASVLYRASRYEEKNRDSLCQDILTYLNRHTSDRSFYPQLLYFASLLTRDKNDSLEYIVQAYSLINYNLLIAKKYFHLTKDKEEFDKFYDRIYNHLGEKYISNMRALGISDGWVK